MYYVCSRRATQCLYLDDSSALTSRPESLGTPTCLDSVGGRDGQSPPFLIDAHMPVTWASLIIDHDAEGEDTGPAYRKQTGSDLWLCPPGAEEWIDDGVDIVVPSEHDRADRWNLISDWRWATDVCLCVPLAFCGQGSFGLFLSLVGGWCYFATFSCRRDRSYPLSSHARSPQRNPVSDRSPHSVLLGLCVSLEEAKRTSQPREVSEQTTSVQCDS
jgi:hypothetical protein